MDIMMGLLGKLEEEYLVLVVMVARQIWFCRNKLMFRGGFASPSLILQVAQDQIKAHQQAEQALQK